MRAFSELQKNDYQEKERESKRKDQGRKNHEEARNRKEEDKRDWLGKVGRKAEVGEGSPQRLGRDKNLPWTRRSQTRACC